LRMLLTQSRKDAKKTKRSESLPYLLDPFASSRLCVSWFFYVRESQSELKGSFLCLSLRLCVFAALGALSLHCFIDRFLNLGKSAHAKPRSRKETQGGLFVQSSLCLFASLRLCVNCLCIASKSGTEFSRWFGSLGWNLNLTQACWHHVDLGPLTHQRVR